MARKTSHQVEHSDSELRSGGSPSAVLGSITPDATELDELASYWARIGVLFGVKPATELVDVELLICDTARAAPGDERLFICAVSWVAQHHAFINGRRLSALAATIDDEASAVLGALLSLASEATEGAAELGAAIGRCRRLPGPRPLFAAMRSMPVLSERVKRNALPLFAAWGLWHDDQTLKPAAVRPVTWLLEKVPELRVRSLLGPSVEADLMARALADEVTVREVARLSFTSYAAVHGAADRLIWRGLLARERVAQSQVLRPTTFALETLRAPRARDVRSLRPRRGAISS